MPRQGSNSNAWIVHTMYCSCTLCTILVEKNSVRYTWRQNWSLILKYNKLFFLEKVSNKSLIYNWKVGTIFWTVYCILEGMQRKCSGQPHIRNVHNITKVSHNYMNNCTMYICTCMFTTLYLLGQNLWTCIRVYGFWYGRFYTYSNSNVTTTLPSCFSNNRGYTLSQKYSESPHKNRTCRGWSIWNGICPVLKSRDRLGFYEEI